MPAFDKYNSKYHNDWGWSLAIKGGTNEEIAEAFGIHKRTLIRWMNKYQTLKDRINEGKASADSKVERSLFEMTKGYEVEEEQRVLDVNKDGSSKLGRIVITKKYVPPNVTAIIFWLKNRDPASWRDRHELTGPDGSSLAPPIITIDFTNARAEIPTETETTGD